MVRREIASGKQIDANIIVRMYWLPLFDFGSGPTQSITTREKAHLALG